MTRDLAADGLRPGDALRLARGQVVYRLGTGSARHVRAGTALVILAAGLGPTRQDTRLLLAGEAVV